MTTTQSTSTDRTHEVTASFLAALERRDFAGMAALLAPTATFRALTPGGVTSGVGPDFLQTCLTTWFGAAEEGYAVDSTVDATTGQKRNLTWRIAITGTDGAVRRAEQHAFVRVTDRIESVDLVCSGFWSAS
jgi:hypothetical protein